LRRENVTVNLSPATENDRRAGGRVISDPEVRWLASWVDPVTGKTRYVYPAAEALGAQDLSRAKFDFARRYGKQRASIMSRNLGVLSRPGPMRDKQLALAVLLLDAFAIRAGHSRTVNITPVQRGVRGLTGLAPNNVTLSRDGRTVGLDFIGKDSVRFVGSGSLPPPAFRALRDLWSRARTRGGRLFDAIDATDLNAYLSTLMPGLTSKVIRTFRASCLFEERLLEVRRKGGTMADAVRAAAIAAAALCNHRLESRPECSAGKAKDIQRPPGRAPDSEHRASRCLATTTTLANYVDPRVIASAERAAAGPHKTSNDTPTSSSSSSSSSSTPKAKKLSSTKPPGRIHGPDLLPRSLRARAAWAFADPVARKGAFRFCPP
jgi:hypothetical protein